MPWTPEQKREARRQRAEAEGRTLGPPGRPRIRPCGTSAGYMRHRRAGEPACEECLRAVAEEQRKRRSE